MRLAKLLKGVTWDEIREAERRREKTMEFELYDILERASIYGRELEGILEDNIKYILKREGLYDPKKMGSIIIPAGALHWECEDNMCWYVADFEVFDKTGNVVLARGTAKGTMLPCDEEEVEVIDMTVSMPVEDVKKLKSLVQAVRKLATSILSLFW